VMSSPVGLIVMRARRSDFSPQWAQQYLAAWEAFSQSSEPHRKTVELRLEDHLRSNQSIQEWNSFYYAKVPVEQVGWPGRVRVTISDVVIKGRVSGDHVLLDVPNNLIRHPAWNPLDTDRLIELARRGSAPAYYPADLQLDGMFYLFDRNHRFEIFKGPKTSRLRVSVHPGAAGQLFLYTGTLRQFQISQGQIEATPQQLVQLHAGAATPFSLIPETQRAKIRFTEDELVRP